MFSVILDSSNTSLTVAVAKDDALLETISYEAWQQQSEYMIPELNKLLEKYGISYKEIGEIIVSVGPGSYTGVRIAITIAKVMALACPSCKVYPISSLAILMDISKPSICLINARSNRSYIGVYDKNNVILKDQIMKNEDVKSYIALHSEYSICGSTNYLGINSENSDVAKTMLFLKKHCSPIADPLALKPVYMKD